MAVSVANQWAVTAAQPSTFGTPPPALQSAVITLTAADSVGGGTGTPAAGNWLFLIAGWNQAGLPAATVTAGDDIHSFWRPGQVITASWPGNTPSGAAAVSPAAASTRTSIWYTPNLARQAGSVYTAPTGMMAGTAVLVIEVAGLGPWDAVTGVYANYAAAATSLNLTLGAPSGQAFFLGAVTGDNSANGQAFAPGGWTALHTTTAANGTDHTCDAQVTAAWTVTSGGISVNGTASSATDLSGAVIGVLTSGPSPAVAGANPNWPSPMKFEAAFGAGYLTPPDQMAWTDLTSRAWSWDEQTGIQYELGEVQATELDLELDNSDQALSADNPGSLYYSNCLNQNMSFQSGVAPWAAWGGSSLAQSAAHAYASAPAAAATYSLQVTPNGSTANPGMTSEYVPVTANTQYTVSGWVLCPAGWATGVQCSLIWYDSSKTLISFGAGSTLAAAGASWTQISDTLTSPAGAAYAVLLFQAGGTPSAATVFSYAECALVPGGSVVTTGLLTTGTPVRIRAAIGTIGGQSVNRWNVISRNAEKWPQQILDLPRSYAPVTGSDIWSVMSGTAPSPYRGAVYQDAPYAWWPCDDQPLAGGVQPVTLRNIAAGNTAPIAITASPNGVTLQDCWGGANPTDLSALFANYSGAPLPGVATYTSGEMSGWMYGDPPSSPSSAAAAGGPVTASPGSGAWTHTGCLGNTGAHGWFLAANDAHFPDAGTAAGVTVEAWFQYPFFFGPAGFVGPFGSGQYGGNDYNVCTQPYCPLTLLELATATVPVAVLQISTGGNLTFSLNGGAPATIYNSSDLRSGAWFHVAIALSSAGYSVYVNGGLTVSGTSASPPGTSAWTWLIVNGDLGSGGGSSLSGIQHSGNVSVSHVAVYPRALPKWRVMAHYCAALTGFGLIPAPSGLQLSQVGNTSPGSGFVPDGSEYKGLYGWVNATTLSNFTFSAVPVAVAGGYASGPGARQTIAGRGVSANPAVGQAVWAQWTTIAPQVQVYTAASAGNETEAGSFCGSAGAFTQAYGASAASGGVCKTGSGTGGSLPSAATPLGDSVAQRLERILSHAGIPCARSIDPAPLLVQAGNDTGGQETGQNLLNIAHSDDGLLFVDNGGYLTYWQKSHLASQYGSPVWNLGPSGGAVPYSRHLTWAGDPTRVWNAIIITPYSPDGATLPDITPSSAAAVTASQKQYGPQPWQITSYLQSQAKMQAQADWVLQQYGTLRIRADRAEVDAASYPAAWPLVLAGNVGDIVTAQNWQVGGGGITGTFRITQIRRHIIFGGRTGDTSAQITVTLDYEPASYWS